MLIMAYIILMLLLLCLDSKATAYKYIKFNSPTDRIIQSENYPQPYPQGANVTWDWNVEFGQWGVVFLDFDLDNGNEHSLDWLEVSDSLHVVKYTTHTPPVLSYISQGPGLVIRFVSDGLAKQNVRGFKLHVLYGTNEREVHMKIHEARKQDKHQQKDESTLLLIITITVLTLIVLIVVIIVVVLLQRNKQSKQSNNRNIFGVRRNSGISHSRRTTSRSSDDAPPNDVELQQQDRHGTSDRQVQRSNSQLNWMARAELSTTLQRTACTARPNDYTPGRVLTNFDTGSNRMIPVSPTRATANVRITGAPSYRNQESRSYESSHDEYCETADSLCQRHGVSRALRHASDDLEPPGYEESCFSDVTFGYDLGNATTSTNSYANVVSAGCQPAACPGSQTNVYINSVDGNAFNEITIDTTSCIIKSARRGDSCKKSFRDSSPTSKESCETKMDNHQTEQKNKQHATRSSSVSSVQIIDGYAFIVPSSTQQFSHSSESAYELSTIATFTQDFVHGNGDVLLAANNHSNTNPSANIYVNT